MLGRHLLTREKVVIKVIKKRTFRRLAKENNISEATAMQLCGDSIHIVNLLETFIFDKKVYLITKYAQGGDLL